MNIILFQSNIFNGKNIVIDENDGKLNYCI